MGYCTSCGWRTAPDDAFCMRCGASVAAGAGSGTPPIQQPPASHQPLGYQQPPAYQQPLGYPPAAQSVHGELADWATRLGGYAIDVGPVYVLILLGILLASASQALTLIFYLISIGVTIYFSVQVGQCGQSPGMRVMGIKCVHTQTGQPIGGGLGVVRSIAHFVDSLICYIGFLFPLWDSQRQTLADKIMSTVVIRVPKLPFSLVPPT